VVDEQEWQQRQRKQRRAHAEAPSGRRLPDDRSGKGTGDQRSGQRDGSNQTDECTNGDPESRMESHGEEGDQLHTGFALEAMPDEVVFIIGPVCGRSGSAGRLGLRG
jgi:hypothetical protein